MDHAQHNRIVKFIWLIADDELRESIFMKGRVWRGFPSY